MGETDATVWVEMDAACEVEVLGANEGTFCVCGHHYALVCLEGLKRGTRTEYEVKPRRRGSLARSPGSEFPAPVIDTLDPERPLRLLFGSCRVALPHEPPFTLEKDEDDGVAATMRCTYSQTRCSRPGTSPRGTSGRTC